MNTATAQVKEVKITDKTILELCKSRSRVNYRHLRHMCRCLRSMGIDFLEMDARSLDKMGGLPHDIEVLYRVESWDDWATVQALQIKQCLLSARMRDQGLNLPSEAGTYLVLELNAHELDDCWRDDRLPGIQNIFSAIRVVGLNRFDQLPLLRKFIEFCRTHQLETDICPDNDLFFGTALALEAFLHKSPRLTASFLGYGHESSLAPLEEVILAIKVAAHQERPVHLKLLPRMAQLMQDMTGIPILDNKPVVGRGIFRYESGIHADGIHKNPATYEPYDPALIGQQRSLTIGKHSGKSAVRTELQRLGIDFNPAVLPELTARIREKSVEFRREIREDEFEQIYRGLA